MPEANHIEAARGRPPSQHVAPPRPGFLTAYEENLRRAMLLSRGDATVFVTQPLSLALLVVSLALLIIVVMPNIRAKREEAFSE